MFIKLSNGMKAIIDSEDWDKIKHITWGYGYGSAKKTGYSQYVGGRPKKSSSQILLHRFVMNTPKGMVTDHINGNKLDNRKSNLRICTPAQNSMNSKKHIIQSSKYKGVSWYKRDKCWRAYVNFGRRQIHLGYFAKEIDAVKAYNKRAKEVHKEFACLNII